MICPDCRSYRLRVLRGSQKDNTYRRRRECVDCGYRFFTVERLVPEREDENEFFTTDKTK